MNQIPNIEETNTREVEGLVEQLFQYYDDIDCAVTVDQRITAREQAELWLKRTLHHQLQKAREASYFKGYNAGLADGTGKPLLTIEQMLQKARQDWLREEIVRLNGVLSEIHNVDGEAWGYELLGKIGSCCPGDDATNVYEHAIQTIIDRYQSELDQDKK